MRRHVQVFLMAIAFDLYWTLVVLFRERGHKHQGRTCEQRG